MKHQTGSIMILLATLLVTACAGPTNSGPGGGEQLSAASAPLPPLGGEALFQLACAGCHRIEAGGAHDVGPNLYGIIGQQAASQPGYPYSAALQAADIHWDRSALAAWVAATEIMVPGTIMTYANILSGTEAARVVDYLVEAADPQGPSNFP